METQDYSYLLDDINSFLYCKTPDAWVAAAQDNLDTLLIDHANCELKAAQTAIYLLRRYALDETEAAALLQVVKGYEDFVYLKTAKLPVLKKNKLIDIDLANKNKFQVNMINKMTCLIKEELHHFEQVATLIKELNIDYKNVAASGYFKNLTRLISTNNKQALVDRLLFGAIIEARSCERFYKVSSVLPLQIKSFYLSLLRSEARHYQDYITLATEYADGDISDRLAMFLKVEADYISNEDQQFNFHSGLPS